MKIKLTTADKIGMVVGGALVWTIGAVPTVLGGGVLYHYRKQIKSYIIKAKAKQMLDGLLSNFK